MPFRVDELYKQIGARIRNAREAAGLTQGELADRLGYASPTTVSYMESGERRISVGDLVVIARVLKVSMSHFCGD